MENKQTAIDWLFNQTETRLLNRDIDITSLFEQAKAMEKEQISNAYFQGLMDGMNNSPKQYYEETYNNKQ